MTFAGKSAPPLTLVNLLVTGALILLQAEEENVNINK